MDFVITAVAVALVWKVVDFLRAVLRRDWNAVATQGTVWAAGVGVVFLVGATQWGDGWAFGDLTVASMNAASKVLAGLAIGGSASAAYDLKRAFDNSDSAAQPPLIG